MSPRHNSPLVREVGAGRASPRLLSTAAAFGFALTPPRTAHAPRAWRDTIARADAALPIHSIAFITGPSGSGKSTLLNLWRARLRSTRTPILSTPTHPPHAPLIDCFAAPVARTIQHLAALGLADALLLARTPSELSEGERARFNLALALAGPALAPGPPAPRPPTLLLDEFTSVLDRTTARSLARSVRRAACALPVRLVLATAHDDILESLAPDALIACDLGAPPVLALSHATGGPR